MDSNYSHPFQWGPEQSETITTGSDYIVHSSDLLGWHPSARMVAMNGMTQALTFLEDYLSDDSSSSILTAPDVTVPPHTLSPSAFVIPPATQFLSPDSSVLDQEMPAAPSSIPTLESKDAQVLQLFLNECMSTSFFFDCYNAISYTVVDPFHAYLRERQAMNWATMYSDMWLMVWNSLGVGKCCGPGETFWSDIIQNTFEYWVRYEDQRPLEHGACFFFFLFRRFTNFTTSS